MASSAKHFSLVLLLILVSCSLHVQARESQFFNKIPSNNNVNMKETELPNKEEPLFKQEQLPNPNKEELLNKQEQEPSFIPQTQNGYGLYGHESGQLPPTTTTTGSAPYKTESQVPFNKNLPDNYNTEAYVTKPQGMSDTRFMDTGYTTTTSTNNNYYNGGNNGYTTTPTNNNKYYNGGRNGYTTTPTNNNNYYYNGGNNGYNVQKQGMSDTRFVENGKYFYDLNSEKYNPNAYENSNGVDSRNEYHNRGYNGNNEKSYEYNNSMEGYQNQEEYQERQDEYMP